LAACQDIPFRYYRYADNLVFLTRNVSIGHRVLHEAHQLLDAAGFAVKGEGGPVDLCRQGAHVEILGFRVRRHSEARLSYQLSREARWNLKRHLSRAHDAPEPARMANLVLRGWLESHGPIFGDVSGRDIVERALRTASQVGLCEVESEEELLCVVREAYKWWMRIYRKALSSDAGVQGGSSSYVHGADALRASQSTRLPAGAAEAGLSGSIPAQTGTIPLCCDGGPWRAAVTVFLHFFYPTSTRSRDAPSGGVRPEGSPTPKEKEVTIVVVAQTYAYGAGESDAAPATSDRVHPAAGGILSRIAQP
jgi:hypothetical protein